MAEVVSELIDTEMYEVWVRRFAQRWQWGRVLASNAVSVPVDTALFTVLAFWGVLPTDVMLSLFLSNILVKFAVTFVSIPGNLPGQGAAEGVVDDEHRSRSITVTPLIERRQVDRTAVSTRGNG